MLLRGLGFADLAFYDYSKVEPLKGLEKNKPGTGAPNYVAGLLAKTLASEMWRDRKPSIFTESGAKNPLEGLNPLEGFFHFNY